MDNKYTVVVNMIDLMADCFEFKNGHDVKDFERYVKIALEEYCHNMAHDMGGGCLKEYYEH